MSTSQRPQARRLNRNGKRWSAKPTYDEDYIPPGQKRPKSKPSKEITAKVADKKQSNESIKESGEHERPSEESEHSSEANELQEDITLPPVDLTVLRYGFQPPLETCDEKLLLWLRSGSVLPLIKQWAVLCLDNEEAKAQIDRMLLGSADQLHPNRARVDQIADHARFYGNQDFTSPLKVKWPKAFVTCANFAYKIEHSNRAFFETSKPYLFKDTERMRAAVAVLFTAYHDLHQHENGFFGILLASPLAQPMRPQPRLWWERKLTFKGEEQYHARRLLELSNPSMPDYASFILANHKQSLRSASTSASRPVPGYKANGGHRKGSDEDGKHERSTDSVNNSDKNHVEIGEPGDEAGRFYKAEAEASYLTIKKLEERLRTTMEDLRASRRTVTHVTIERDSLRTQLQSAVVESARGQQGRKRKRSDASEQTDTEKPGLGPMADANKQLWRENEELRQSLRGGQELSTEEAMRALRQSKCKGGSCQWRAEYLRSTSVSRKLETCGR